MNDQSKKQQLSPMEFLVQIVLPALFERLDEAFPEFAWRKTSRGWRASDPTFIKKHFAVSPRQVEANFPTGFMIDGTRYMSWPAYVNHGTAPSGPDFVQVIRTLAQKAAIEADWLGSEPTPEEENQRRRANLLETFMAHAQAALWTDAGQIARSYLVGQRGFSKVQIKDPFFGLYTSTSDINDQLQEAGFTTEEIDQVGLLADQRWENRLVFPWRNRWGRIQTVAARDLTNTANDTAKFLYLPGQDVPPAFGLHRALRIDDGRWDLILVQGLIDAVYLHTHGCPNVAAIGGNGKLLTAQRWEALSHYGVRCVTLAMDQDEAGRSGLMVALEQLQQVKHPPSVFVTDPDSLGTNYNIGSLARQYGSFDALRPILDRRIPAAIYRGKVILNGVVPASPHHHRRVAAIKILDYAAKLEHPEALFDREDLLQLAAEATGYHRHILFSLMQERIRQRESTASPS